MVKRVFACVLAFCLLFLTACKSPTAETEEWLMKELEMDSRPLIDTEMPESSDEPELIGNTESEDPLRICIDLIDFGTPDEEIDLGTPDDGVVYGTPDYGWIDRIYSDLLYRLKETTGLDDVVLDIIPSQYAKAGGKDIYNTARTEAIERIESEIQTGGGPDVFIMAYQVGRNFTIPASINYDMRNCLFMYPQKAMDDGVFLPLDEYMENNTKLTEWDKLTQPVLEAGRNWEGQQIIPLDYIFPVLCYLKSEWEHVPDKAYTWDDMLTNPALLPYSHDMANCFNSDFYGVPSPITEYLEYIMGTFADFENEELCFTEEELLKCVNDILALKQADDYEKFPDVKEVYVGLDLSHQKMNRPLTFLPLYNTDGGITANIKTYAAVNRNTKKPEDAFKVIDLLMSKDFQRSSKIYEFLLFHGNFGSIPLHEELFQTAAPLCGYYMGVDNFAAFCKLREQITCANFDSQGTRLLSNMMNKCYEAAEWKMTVEEIVHEAYEDMTRRISE